MGNARTGRTGATLHDLYESSIARFQPQLNTQGSTGSSRAFRTSCHNKRISRVLSWRVCVNGQAFADRRSVGYLCRDTYSCTWPAARPTRWRDSRLVDVNRCLLSVAQSEVTHRYRCRNIDLCKDSVGSKYGIENIGIALTRIERHLL